MARSGERDLLDAAEQAGFEILLTCDQNIRYQQNFSARKLSVVIFIDKSLAKPAASSRPGCQ